MTWLFSPVLGGDTPPQLPESTAIGAAEDKKYDF
jgi:hypothetical protein